MDVKCAFLNGYLEKDVFIEQPLRYIKAQNTYKVLKLKKALNLWIKTSSKSMVQQD